MAVINKVFADEEKKYDKHNKSLVTEIEPFKSFYEAEDYHQKYLEKNPGGYCHINLDSIPKDINEIESTNSKLINNRDFDECNYKYLTPEEKEERLKKLSPIEYEVTQNNATEAPDTGKYNDFHEEGLFVDIVSGEPLFTSLDKFDSDCVWSSLTKPVGEDIISENEDTSHGMIRTELKSKIADSHLEHVFNNDPIQKVGKYIVLILHL